MNENRTVWQVQPSFKNEVFCFSNILTADPFYLDYYQAEYNKFEPRLTSEEHDPSFGYNTFDGLIEEDCVQALDQLVGEQLGIAAEPRQRWKNSDNGLHVFAVALYSVLSAENYSSQPKKSSFQDYFINLLHTRLKPGTIKAIYNDFYQQA
jgi:hypothetical protein